MKTAELGSRLGVALVAAFLVLAHAGEAGAQLISPGKLSAAHADLEGIRNCTQCHELRKQGISQTLCLRCHTPLANRLATDRGFHASLPDKACASCHKEHFGVDFALVRMDTLTFDHERAGYPLDGGHLDVSCRACHTPDHVTDEAVRAFKGERGALQRTFLGLSPTCTSCHETDAPHEDQFAGQACSECHATGGWDQAPNFEHGGTAFPLTGEHRTVSCDKCHGSMPRPGGAPDVVRYAGVAHARCNDCHQDEHRGAMPGACAGCHTTGGWKDLDRRRLESSFNHASTGFRLEGRHATAPCASCHDAGASSALPGIHIGFQAGGEGSLFPKPDGTECRSCHEDEHAGVMSQRCETCHTPARWDRVDARRLADSFDHASTGYTLEGTHAAAPCASCHDDAAAAALQGIEISFTPGSETRAFPSPEHATCLACHQDRHGGAFADAPSGPDCRACHGEVAWLPSAFDVGRHNVETPFLLEGAHAVVACVDCHVPSGPDPSFAVAGTECSACHQDVDPHGGQFTGRSCGSCHTTSAFDRLLFDHDRTRFPLDGAHRNATCQSCHKAETDPSGRSVVRYRPLGTECRDCHGGSA